MIEAGLLGTMAAREGGREKSDGAGAAIRLYERLLVLLD